MDKKIIIKETENGTFGVFYEGYEEPLKEFDEFSQADMWKENYVVEREIKIHDISDELLKNTPIKIPEYVCFPKYKTIEIEENTLTLFAAKPGNGKTLFLVDFMRECLKKEYKCLFFSLEMSKETIKKRYKDEDLVFTSDKIILKDRSDMTLTNLETTIKYYLNSNFGKPDFIFLDYIQFLSTDDLALKEFASQIKRLSKKYKIRFVCAAQLNANFSIDKPNDIVDAMSGSREISKTSEMIILCYKQDGVFNLEIVKNRNGDNGPNTHLYFMLNKENGILEEFNDFDKDEDDIKASREVIIAHELGHNFLQFLLTKKISPICITDWGGFVVAKKTNSDNELKVLYAGVICEAQLNPDSSPIGQQSDMNKIDRIMKGLYLKENLYINPNYDDDDESKKFEAFKRKYLSKIVNEVSTVLSDNAIKLQKIWKKLCDNVEKTIYTSEEIEELLSKETWISKSI
ncbi:MAG: hypothetical protein Ta2E_06390 [Mycoplasmoidaceae bacterium]|nr:MAG: hypothetical protein Ta2E_06390 [Mycoplasmoidaceae bacterium]